MTKEDKSISYYEAISSLYKVRNEAEQEARNAGPGDIMGNAIFGFGSRNSKKFAEGFRRGGIAAILTLAGVAAFLAPVFIYYLISRGPS